MPEVNIQLYEGADILQNVEKHIRDHEDKSTDPSLLTEATFENENSLSPILTINHKFCGNACSNLTNAQKETNCSCTKDNKSGAAIPNCSGESPKSEEIAKFGVTETILQTLDTMTSFT